MNPEVHVDWAAIRVLIFCCVICFYQSHVKRRTAMIHLFTWTLNKYNTNMIFFIRKSVQYIRIIYYFMKVSSLIAGFCHIRTPSTLVYISVSQYHVYGIHSIIHYVCICSCSPRFLFKWQVSRCFSNEFCSSSS